MPNNYRSPNMEPQPEMWTYAYVTMSTSAPGCSLLK